MTNSSQVVFKVKKEEVILTESRRRKHNDEKLIRAAIKLSALVNLEVKKEVSLVKDEPNDASSAEELIKDKTLTTTEYESKELKKSRKRKNERMTAMNKKNRLLMEKKVKKKAEPVLAKQITSLETQDLSTNIISTDLVLKSLMSENEELRTKLASKEIENNILRTDIKEVIEWYEARIQKFKKILEGDSQQEKENVRPEINECGVNVADNYPVLNNDVDSGSFGMENLSNFEEETSHDQEQKESDTDETVIVTADEVQSNLQENAVSSSSERDTSSRQQDYSEPNEESDDDHVKNSIVKETGLFVCLECNKSYTSKRGLQLHERTHTGELLACNSCDTKFTQAGDLKIHVRTVHDDEQLFPCDICGRSFRFPGSMKTHRKTHLGRFEKKALADKKKKK